MQGVPTSKATHTFFTLPILVVLVVVLVLAGAYFYSSGGWRMSYPERMPYAVPTSPSAPKEVVSAEEKGLGAEIFQKVSNPVQDALPETVAPTVNPVQGLYRNPFE